MRLIDSNLHLGDPSTKTGVSDPINRKDTYRYVLVGSK